jgi:hypothetical protein
VPEVETLSSSGTRDQASLAEMLIRATQDRERPRDRRSRLAGREEGRLVEAEIIARHLKQSLTPPKPLRTMI